VVVERELGATMAGSINGPLTLNYHAMIESIFTQAGSMSGKLVAGDYSLKMDGAIEPLAWLGTPFASPAQLTMSGDWKFLGGTQGSGTFTAWAIFIPTPEGHVGQILYSGIAMTGQWKP